MSIRMIHNALLPVSTELFRISTMAIISRIGKLAKITPEDCVKIDSLMTKYSCFEHSQSEEAPTWFPEPDEFRADVVALQTWIKIFTAR